MSLTPAALGCPHPRSGQLGKGVRAAQPWAPWGGAAGREQAESRHCPLDRPFFSPEAGQCPVEC